MKIDRYIVCLDAYVLVAEQRAVSGDVQKLQH
jgi:hypothetical protein